MNGYLERRPYSASMVNLFSNSPAAFLLTYGYGRRAHNQWMDRGNQVETYLRALMMNRGLPIIAELHNEFVKACVPFMRWLHFEENFELDSQHGQTVRYGIPEIHPEASVVGHLDFVTKRRFLDLKTTSRTPPANMPYHHSIQAAMYLRAWYGTPVDMWPEVTFVYAIHNKSASKCVVYTTDHERLNVWKEAHKAEIRPLKHEWLVNTWKHALARIAQIEHLRRYSVNELARLYPVLPNDHELSNFPGEIVDDYAAGRLEPISLETQGYEITDDKQEKW